MSQTIVESGGWPVTSLAGDSAKGKTTLRVSSGKNEAIEMEAQELLKTSGVVEAVAQHDERRYSIKVGGEWYGGFGTCPAEKGVAYVIDYAENGRWKNIKSIREQGEAVSETYESQRTGIQERNGVEAKSAREPVRVASVRNYQTKDGWQQEQITAEEDRKIQQSVRDRNARIAGECLHDAEVILRSSSEGEGKSIATPNNIVEIGVLLAERRIPHVTSAYSEFLTWKIAQKRNPRQEEAEASSSSSFGLPMDLSIGISKSLYMSGGNYW